MKIIAISGWKRSGKDSTAEHLVERYNFTRVSFADPLKKMVSEEYGIPVEHCNDPKFKEAPILHLPVTPKDKFTLELSKMLYTEFRTASGYPSMDFYTDASGAFLGVSGRGNLEQLYWTPRALCILKGSTNRAVQSDYWVGKAIDHINSLEGNFVISDLRYQSELTQLREAFGKDLLTIRINRFDSTQSLDPSERDLDNSKFDVVIENKGSLEEFIVKLDEVLNV